MCTSRSLGRGVALLLGVVAAVAPVAACSNDARQTPASSTSSSGSSGTSGSVSSGTGGASGGDSGTSAPSDLGACTTFVDRSDPAADRRIFWDTALPSRPEHCMKIAVGQKIRLVLPPDGTAAGDFVNHPPSPNGGDTPNPFFDINLTTGEVTFPAKGTFRYKCDVHSFMAGAIQVE